MFAISCNTSVVFNLFKWFIFFVFQIIFFEIFFPNFMLKDILISDTRIKWDTHGYLAFSICFVWCRKLDLYFQINGFFLFCYEKQIIGVVLLIFASILLLLSVLVHTCSKYKSREHIIFLFWKKSCYFLSRH